MKLLLLRATSIGRIALFCCVIAGCATDQDLNKSYTPTDSAIEFNTGNFVLPSEMPVPKGVQPEVWLLLTEELETQLNSRLRSVNLPPMSFSSKTTLTTVASTFHWRYFSQGDYDQNGEVNAADLTLLAIHYLESALPDVFPPDSIQSVIDGDGNGELNLADVTPIAVNFRNTIKGYNIYRSQNAADFPEDAADGNGSAQLLAGIDLSASQGPPNEVRLRFSLEMPEKLDSDYFWVRPVDNEEVEGVASNLNGPHTNVYSLDGYVFMAGGGSDPLSGVPVELTGETTAFATTDANGHYSFAGLLNGDYIVTPPGDPYGYAPESINATIENADRFVSPFHPISVDIVHRWTLDYPANMNCLSMATDPEDNVFIAGSVGASSIFRNFILKYDMFGNLLWSRHFYLYYDIVNMQLVIGPEGEIYVLGQHQTIDSLDPDNADLLVLKLDNLGSILWEFSYNYPTSDSVDHQDSPRNLCLDKQGNLIIYSKSKRGPEEPQYRLKVSPEGELLEQQHFEVSSASFDNLAISNSAADPAGGAFLSGMLTPEWGPNKQFLLRVSPTGEIEWANNWGSIYMSGASVKRGMDGYLYVLSEEDSTGISGDKGILLSRFHFDGSLDYQSKVSTPDKLRSFRHAIGPQGKIWISGHEEMDVTPPPLFASYPFLWSLNPDGTTRFTRQWQPDPVVGPSNNAIPAGLQVNSFGVAVIAGSAHMGSGDWTEHNVNVEAANWPINHEDISIAQDALAPKRSIAVDEISDNEIEDPEPDSHSKIIVWYYRP